MKLKAWINGVSYPLVQGCTFSEEYNETLDSGSIIISNVSQLDLKPYDDVIIFDASKGSISGWAKRYKDFGKKPEFFYKHLLVDQFVEEVVYLGDETGEVDDYNQPAIENMVFKYKIELFSETKKLETIQLPNISVTQPVKETERKTVKQLLQQFLEVYNVKEKVSINKDGTYEIVNKYEFDEATLDIFENVYSPEFTLNNPNLRDVISQLFITRDMIPYVENDVIFAMDITRRNGVFNLNVGQYNYITGSLSSENYCSNLRRTYSDALSQDSTGRSIEYIGFRNNDTPLMTFDNMRLELEFPIYKINKIYMCYYRKVNVMRKEDSQPKDYMFLCKQDITPLVKLNSERNVLSQDWDDFNENYPQTIEDMGRYKLCTLGYDIGSNYIEGWGNKYTYPQGWWQADKTASYLENILNVLDDVRPYGIYNIKDFEKVSGELFAIERSKWENNIIPSEDTFISNDVYKMKSLFFIVDYTPFYNGTIIHSKNFGERNGFITVNDNPSSSLTLLESDGLSQDEKLNRFGNKGLTITSRYKTDIETKQYEDSDGQIQYNYFYPLQPLGSVYNRGDDEDIIIYHREYSIFNNEIVCTYYGSKDYVLKNYYTNVYAKHRTYNLMSYGESVKRTENEKMFLLLSKNRSHYEKDKIFSFENFTTNEYDVLLSFAKKTKDFEKTDDFKEQDKLNNALFYYEKKGDGSNDDKGHLLKQTNIFTSGRSICFNMTTKDNIASNPYIKKFKPDYKIIDATKDFTGSVQDFDSFADEYGFTKNVNFVVGHLQENTYVDNGIKDYDKTKVQDTYKYLFKIPTLTNEQAANYLNLFQNKISIKDNKTIYKDNKEVIDMTYQIEAITDDNNVMFSPWMVKLNDLTDNYKKFTKEKTAVGIVGDKVLFYCKSSMGYFYFNGLTGENYNVNLDGFSKSSGVMFLLRISKNSLVFPQLGEKDLEKTKEYKLEGIVVPNVRFLNTDQTGSNLQGIKLEFKKIVLSSIKKENGMEKKATVYASVTLFLKEETYHNENMIFATKIITTSGTGSEEELPNIDNDYYLLTNISGNDLPFYNENNEEVSFSFTQQYSKLVVPEYWENINDFSFDYEAKQFQDDYLSIGEWEDFTSTYHKNMFFVKAPGLKKTSVYEEFKELPYKEDPSIKFEVLIPPKGTLFAPVILNHKITTSQGATEDEDYSVSYKIYNPNNLQVYANVGGKQIILYAGQTYKESYNTSETSYTISAYFEAEYWSNSDTTTVSGQYEEPELTTLESPIFEKFSVTLTDNENPYEYYYNIYNPNDILVYARIICSDFADGYKTVEISANDNYSETFYLSTDSCTIDVYFYKEGYNVSSTISKTVTYEEKLISLEGPVFESTSLRETGTDEYTLSYNIYNPNNINVQATINIDGTFYKTVEISALSSIGGTAIVDSDTVILEVGFLAAINPEKYENPFSNVTVSTTSTLSTFSLRRSVATPSEELFYNLKITFDNTDMGLKYQVGDSIRYYYKNNSDFSKNNDGNYHFVFGVNLTQEDIDNGYVIIYLSLINNKDKYIYDQNHNIIGEIYNFLDRGKDEYYGGEENVYKEV